MCIYYFRQTSLWNGFLFHRSRCFAISSSHLRILAVLSLSAAALHSPALLGLHRTAPLAVVPAGAIAHLCPAQAVPAHFSSEQSVLCWLSLHSPPQLPNLLVFPSSSSPALLLAPSSSSALPAILVRSTFCHFSVGPLQRGAYQFSWLFSSLKQLSSE